MALSRVAASGLKPDSVADFFRTALISPVLTAHPTEVQRKSILDRHLELARLLNERDRSELTPAEQRANEEQLRRTCHF